MNPRSDARSEQQVEWYYVDAGDRQGPISTWKLLGLLVGQELPRSTPVWRKGLDSWTPAEEAEPLSILLPPPPPEESARPPPETTPSSAKASPSNGKKDSPPRPYPDASTSNKAGKGLVAVFVVATIIVAGISYNTLTKPRTTASNRPPEVQQPLETQDLSQPVDEPTPPQIDEPASSQTSSLSRLREQAANGLTLLTPGQFKSEPFGEQQIADNEAFNDARVFQAIAEQSGVFVWHYALAQGASYDLKRGFRGALSGMEENIGRDLAMDVRDTVIDGDDALWAESKRFTAEGTEMNLRILMIRDLPNVWAVGVFSTVGSRERADSILASVRVSP